MALWETVAGGVVGGLTGALTAYVTAQGKVKAVRAEFEGKLQQMRLARTHDLEDRANESAAASAAVTEERLTALVAAATRLATALRSPDGMQHNVRKAKNEVATATAAIHDDGELADLAQRLIRASKVEDPDEAEALARDLRLLRS